MSGFSTRLKAAFGYLILAVLTLVAVYFVNESLTRLTESDGVEDSLNRRQRVTNDIVYHLYQSEIVGQSISGGQTEHYDRYIGTMMKASASIDTLRTLIGDSVQIARLDSVGVLLEKKAANMLALSVAIQSDNSDELYRQYIDELINRQHDELEIPQVQKSEVVRTNNYTMVAKRKNFFGRLRDAFSRRNADSTYVSNVVVEEHTDTVMQAYNPADTVAKMLTSVRNRVSDTRLSQINARNREVHALQASGIELSHKVNKLLSVIVDESENANAARHAQEEQIRRESAWKIATIALVGIGLAIVFLIIIWRDITRSTRYRQELEVAKRHAESLLETREKLMLTITHDIKAPVGSIIGYSDLLEQTTVDEQQRAYLGNMQSSANHLLNLVNSLLDFHRLDANKMDTNLTAFNPYRLFGDISVSFQPLTAAKNLGFDYSCDKQLDRTFRGDPFHIRQIAENLLSNAIKFTAEGSVSLSVGMQDGNLLEFSVSDTGCGIGEEEQTLIFHEFTRLKNAQGQEGFGLGLAITGKLVHLLGGEIAIESEQGKGTRFLVRLPIEAAYDEETGSPEAIGSRAVSRLSGKYRLLLIDDDRIQLQLTSQMLKSIGAEVACCTQPDELLDCLEESLFDAVLSDIQMPAMNGFDLLKAIRSLPCPQAGRIPVIALTARSDINAASLRSEGFADCLHKPFNRQEAAEAINDAIGTPQPKRYRFSSLITFAGDDKEATAEIIGTFVSETERNRQRLLAALDSNDIKETAETAHKMLPLFSMIEADTTELLRELNEKRTSTAMTGDDREAAIVILAETRIILTDARQFADDKLSF